MVSIILNGANGKMGQTIINLVSASQSFEIVAGVDVNCNKIENFQVKHNFPIEANFPKIKADVVIDFSNPAALDSVLNFSKQTKTALVVATTGYSNEQIEKIKETSKEIPIFFSFNMSLGINLLINLIKKSYQVLGDRFDVEIVEKHHNQKIDAPSGTALMLADAIKEEAGGEVSYSFSRHNLNKKRDSKEIGIHSIRGGTIVGEHEVIFAGKDETITLTHNASSKKIFATGALKAADFIKNKNPGLYSMEDLINNQN